MPSKREIRRQQLIELGVKLFAERAYDEVAIDDLAREAGISKGLMYHYFGSKKALYLACVEHVAGELVTELQAMEYTDPGQGIRLGLDTFLSFISQHGQSYRSLMTGASGGDIGVHGFFDRTRQAIAGLILMGLGVSPDHPQYRNTVRAWVGAVEASALDWLANEGPDQAELVDMHTTALADRLYYVHQRYPDAASADAMQPVLDARGS